MQFSFQLVEHILVHKKIFQFIKRCNFLASFYLMRMIQRKDAALAMRRPTQMIHLKMFKSELPINLTFSVGILGFLLHQIIDLISEVKWEQTQEYIQVKCKLIQLNILKNIF